MPTLPYNNIAGRSVVSTAELAALRFKAYAEKAIQKQMSVDGVFEGGGALGSAYLGGIKALHDNGIWFRRVAGNSAGSIFAAMIAVGFTAPEIQWLCSAFPNPPSVPTTLSDLNITSPIPFADFLDLPNINSISQSHKRATLLWQALKGAVLDEIGKISVPVPTQGEAVDACVKGVMSVPLLGTALTGPGEAALRGAINIALAPLPNQQLHIKDFMLDTEALRIALADTLWDAIMRNNPLQLVMVNLVHEGSIFEGTVFLNTIKALFGKKVHNNATATVLFKDLKVPLAVIAADIDTGEMLVYSSRNHPNVEVAEVVRQSMSIPFVFEPRGTKRQIVDGGLFSNFPVWVYSAAGNNHWQQADIDPARVKIGFSLDETAPAPPAWNVQPPKFQLTGNPPHVDALEVFKPILIEKLVALGMPRTLAESEVTWALIGTPISGGTERLELIQEILGVTKRGVMNTEESTRKETTAGLMRGLPYIDIPIPLLGYDGFDFYINEDEGALMARWDRAWQKTIEGLSAAAAQNLLPPLMRISNTQTPFN
jgi:predicted acylesterase/phospholipase RssA